MKFSYKFSNLLGSIYRTGNVVFTADGNALISPVGNRLTIFDLKNNKTHTLPVDSRLNYTSIALSPDGTLLLAVNENGQGQLISMISGAVIHQHKFHNAVRAICFSPNGAHFAVAFENIVLVFRAPGEITGEYNPFVLERYFIGGYDDVTWLDWSSDSRFLAVGCRDNTTKIIALRRLNNFRTFIMGGHTDAIVACFFEADSMHVNTISRNGQLCLWECSMMPSDIREYDGPAIDNEEAPEKKKKKQIDVNNDDDDDDLSEDDVDNTVEKPNEEIEKNAAIDENEEKDIKKAKGHPFYYNKLIRHYLANEPRKEHRDAVVSCVSYNRQSKILVLAFSTGAFYLYELPEVNMIHSLSISDYPISAAVFNNTGDWVALASKELGQLLVWEWQSEQYIMKQQGHTSEMTCISYSPDGQYIASGGEDGKVKLWNTQSGFCFVTFSEHTSGVTGVQFSRSKKFLVSSSMDGTVRAYDIIRYRNFRTFTAPRHVQFACVAIDYSGEFVVAGGQDVFEIFLWSIKLGTLLEVISGHEGPVSSIAFSPVATSSILISGSWDKTIKIWNCLEKNSEHETIDMLSDVTCVAFNPNGEEFSVATLNGNITAFDVKTSTQISSIEGRNDLGSGRLETDLITAKKNLDAKYFSSIEYSADGECILAGGKSQMVCIYHVREAMLTKKFEITQNHSLDGLNEYVDRKHLSEFGNMALVEQREELEGGNVSIRLPGVQKGDMAARKFKPEVKVMCVRFSPTGQSFGVACTEGLCIYSLDKGIVFDPLNLSMEVTPKAIKAALKGEEYADALLMALKLNENDLLLMVLEQIPHAEIKLICGSLPDIFAHRLLQTIARTLQTTPHVEFYLEWACSLLATHGNKDNVFEHTSLLGLHDSISRKYEMLSKICDFSKYTMRVLLKAADEQAKSGKDIHGSETDDDENDDVDMLLIKSVENNEQEEEEFTTGSESD